MWVRTRPEGGLPDCGEGATNGERVVLALPRFAYPQFPPSSKDPNPPDSSALVPLIARFYPQVPDPRCERPSVSHLLMAKG